MLSSSSSSSLAAVAWMVAFLFLMTHAGVADANFFTRLARFRDDADKAKSANRAQSSSPSAVSTKQGPQGPVGNTVTFADGVPMIRLANKNSMPLVGLGVGNMQHDLIAEMVEEAIQDDKKTRLIDTAHASRNEHLVARGIVNGVKRMQRRGGEKDYPVQVHVVTKVWYTHLGYERTKFAVKESLEELKPAIDDPMVDLRVHFLLHWPRCFDNIPWMNCDREEQELPQVVRELGPDPSKDPDNAWKESWKALEDMYLSKDEYPEIASIGVSNFHVQLLESMDAFARIHPHVTQVNVWSMLYDPHLVDFCQKEGIHIQAYNTLGGTITQKRSTAPKAYHHLQQIMYDVKKEMRQGEDVTPAQVILSWLIQHGVSVIPRTTRLERLDENSSASLTNLPALSDHQVMTLAHVVEAYLSGDDLEQDIHVTATFYAKTQDMVLYWMGHDGQDIRVALIRKGDKFEETTYPNHMFRTYLATNKDIYLDHHIDVNFGEHKDIHVEL